MGSCYNKIEINAPITAVRETIKDIPNYVVSAWGCYFTCYGRRQKW